MDFVADYLFRDETGVVSRALDREQTRRRTLSGQFITLHDPGRDVSYGFGGDAAERRASSA